MQIKADFRHFQTFPKEIQGIRRKMQNNSPSAGKVVVKLTCSVNQWHREVTQPVGEAICSENHKDLYLFDY